MEALQGSLYSIIIHGIPRLKAYKNSLCFLIFMIDRGYTTYSMDAIGILNPS